MFFKKVTLQQIACISYVSINNNNMKTKFTFLVAAILAIASSVQAQSHDRPRSAPQRPSAPHRPSAPPSREYHHSNNGMRNVLAVVGAGLIVNSIIESNRPAYYYSTEPVYIAPDVNYTTIATREYYWDRSMGYWRTRIVYTRVPCYPN